MIKPNSDEFGYFYLKVNFSNAQSQNHNELRAIFLSYNNKKAENSSAL